MESHPSKMGGFDTPAVENMTNFGMLASPSPSKLGDSSSPMIDAKLRRPSVLNYREIRRLANQATIRKGREDNGENDNEDYI